MHVNSIYIVLMGSKIVAFSDKWLLKTGGI